MKHFYATYRKLLTLLLLFGRIFIAQASDEGPGAKKKESGKPSTPVIVAADANAPKVVNAELNKAFAKLQAQLSAQNYVDKMEDLNLFVPTSAGNDRNAAQGMFEHLDNI